MLASFSISPVGVGEALSKHVAEIIDIIDKSGLKYKLGAMQRFLPHMIQSIRCAKEASERKSHEDLYTPANRKH